MKREVKAPKGAQIKSPEPPRSEIRQFGNAIEYMVDQMSKRWRTQILKELNQDTISKILGRDPGRKLCQSVSGHGRTSPKEAVEAV